MSALVRALEATLQSNVTSAVSHRYEKLKKDAGTLLQDEFRHRLLKFGEELTKNVQDCFPVLSSRPWRPSDGEKCLEAFMALRIDVLPQLWKSFYAEIEMCDDDPLLPQCVNRRLFEICLSEHLESGAASASATEEGHSTVCASLSVDEENALQYASGFIPFKLLRKYRSLSSEKALAFTSCLQNMKVEESEMSLDHDYTFVAYTRRWIDLVDRGGLFKVNSSAYAFFLSVGRIKSNYAKKHLSKRSLAP